MTIELTRVAVMTRDLACAPFGLGLQVSVTAESASFEVDYAAGAARSPPARRI